MLALGLAGCGVGGCVSGGQGEVRPLGLAHVPAPAAAAAPPPEASPRRVTRGGGHAVEAAGQTPVDPAELDLPYGEILNPSRFLPGSMSLGTTASGSLAREAALPYEGEHHAVIPSCRPRRTNFGTEELVELLLHAGEAVGEAAPGARLMICNMAQNGGGDLKWSHSHNSGRDADLAFYALKDGQPVDAPGLQRFGSDLKEVGGGHTFDVVRNWALVKGLLSHPRVQVQWLFISNPLKDALLRWAEAQGEPEALIERARTVLWQPTDSSPHNDHLHLRIYCSREDVLEGCVNTGPTWAWIDTYEGPRKARARALAEAFGDPEEGTRLGAIAFLQRIEGTLASPELSQVISRDPSLKVRRAALELLTRWGRLTPELLAGLEQMIRRPGRGLTQDDPGFTSAPAEVKVASAEGWPAGVAHPGEDAIRDAGLLREAWRALGLLADAQAVPLLEAGLRSKRRVGDGGRGVPEALLAAEACRHVLDKRLVPALIELLESEESEVRAPAAEALERITNHGVGVRWERKLSAKEQRRGVEAWRQWWREHKEAPREDWVLAGFRRAKLKVGSLEGWDTVAALVPATKRDDAVGYNADRVIASITGRWSPKESTGAARYGRWRAWWGKNEQRLRRRGTPR